MRSSDPVPVLYIGGCGRSGSTLLSSLIGLHAEFFPVGELDVWQALRTDELCGCGEAFSQCTFWGAVGRAAFGGWEQVDLNRMLKMYDDFARHRRMPRLVASNGSAKIPGFDEYTDVLACLYSAIKAVSGSSVIVDSSKSPAYALVLRRVPALDLRFVHLVRDSRGVAYSWSKQGVVNPQYAHHPTLSHQFMRQESPWKTALEWDVKNLLFKVFMPSKRRLLVKYESVIADPVGELDRILNFVGVSTQPAALNAHEFDLLPFHTLGGNPVRFQRGRISLKEDLEWKRGMPRFQRNLVSLLTFPLLLAYGYVPIPRPLSRR